MPFVLPVIDTTTAPFWDAASQGQLLFKWCSQCEQPHFYPRPFCPHCWSAAVEWREASGRGTVYSYSVVRVNDHPAFIGRVPYAAALIDLEEGPRMMSIVVGGLEEVQVGSPVAVEFEARGDLHLPVFRISDGAGPDARARNR